MTAEQWRPVVGYEGWYAVSDRGRIRRVLLNNGRQHGESIAQRRDWTGYRRVSLWRHNVQVVASVHVLVAEAFHGPRRPGLQVHHKNRRRADNRAVNLAWMTASDNSLQSAPRGAAVGNARLTDDQVREIRALRGTMPERAIAKQFGISRWAARDIWQGRSWAWLS